MSQCWPLAGMTIAQKAVLISLADNANDQGVCWPSIPTIAARVCASERAVQNAIKWLESAKIVTANRSNGRHTSYTLTPAAYSPPQDIHPRTKCTGEGNAPAKEMHHTPAGDAGDPRSKCTTPPHHVPSNRKEPSVNRKGTVKGARASRRVESTINLPDWLPEEAWANWVAYRRKGKAPFTDHAATLSVEALGTLRAAGYEPVAVINQSILRGWTGLFPVKDAANPAEQGPTTSGAGAIWWDSASGIEAKGAELKVERRPEWNGLTYKMHVFRAAGPGAWIESELAKAQKANPNEYERAFAFFHGVSATKFEELKKRGAP